MAIQHSIKDSIYDAMEEIRATKGVIECALVSRDGTLIGKSLWENVSASDFAAISASILASAEAANNVLSLPRPSYLVAFSRDVHLLVMSAGEQMLVSATVDKKIDISPVYERIQEITLRIGGKVES
ncbi:MAG: roadblock/LC7 domain-containing protein [Methanomicrobiales archaeon]|nr:roadblock/LC7 domain-containing protein [Methanomicrobiales archaeon]